MSNITIYGNNYCRYTLLANNGSWPTGQYKTQIRSKVTQGTEKHKKPTNLKKLNDKRLTTFHLINTKRNQLFINKQS